MTKTLIVAKDTPAPGGAYSPALAVGDWLFVAGQGGFDGSTGELVSDEIEGQTEQAFRNIDALLEAAGLTRSDIVSCVVHLSDLSLFPATTRPTSGSSPTSRGRCGPRSERRSSRTCSSK